jgi:hypothetical protein
MTKMTVEVDGVVHTVIIHDPARQEFFVSASDAASGAFYLCSTRPRGRGCTCRAGQHGFSHIKARAHCKHVEAALRASVLIAAATLQQGTVGFGALNLPDPFA